MKINKRKCTNFLIAILVLVIVLNISTISASKPSEDIDIFVEFHSSSVIRTGNIFPASITIRNLNENLTLDIKKVTILNDGKKIIKAEDINKEIKSLKKILKREEEIRDYLQKPEFCEIPGLTEEQPEYQEYIKIISEIKNEMEDRFGKIPKEVENLLEIGKIRLIAMKSGILKITFTRSSVQIKFSSDTSVEPAKVIAVLSAGDGSAVPNGGKNKKFRFIKNDLLEVFSGCDIPAEKNIIFVKNLLHSFQ